MRPRALLAGLLLLGAVGLVAVGLSGSPDRAATEADRAAPATQEPVGSVASDGRDGPLLDVEGGDDVAVPVRVRVPSLGIDSRLDRIGVDARRVLESPPRWQVAGWFAGGPRPGQDGPAVIAGHVDSPDGAAVFTGLSRLRPGDTVEVDDAAGDTRVFEVDGLARAPRDDFPTEAVYGPTPDAQLRLITCDGPYVDGGYQDNLIVYATEEAA